MPPIHPSEDPPLGWLVPCLAVANLEASLSFYHQLDLVQYGGSVVERWAMLRNRAVEIHLFEKHISIDLLNFRGGDLGAIRKALGRRGLLVESEQGEKSFIYLDPDGREVFFDTSPEESRDYRDGRPLTIPFGGDDVHQGEGLDLGNLTWCLACVDLDAASDFYRKLGLVPAGGEPRKGWVILARPDHLPEPGVRLIATYLSLFCGKIPRDTISFRGGDVAAIARTIEERGIGIGHGVVTAKDGGESLLIEDPDGRPVLFDTTPPERLYEERSS